MIEKTDNHTRRRLLYSVFSVAVFTTLIWYMSAFTPNAEAGETLAPQAPLAMMTYAGSGTGAIPDDDPAGLSVTFNVSGLPSGQTVTNVSLELTMVHTWLGDLTGVLSAPPAFGNSHIIFQEISDTSGTGGGDPSNFNGTYTFDDSQTGDIWVVTSCPTCGNAYDIPSGGYRTSAPLTGALTFMNPAFQSVVVPLSDPGTQTKETSLKRSFEGMPTELATGTWTFFIDDNAVGDLGSVTGANLTLTTAAPTAAPASISGRVLSSTGIALRNVNVTLIGGQFAQPIQTRTNHFGYYYFSEIPVGDTYILSVSGKNQTFETPTRVVSVFDNVTGFDFIAN